MYMVIVIFIKVNPCSKYYSLKLIFFFAIFEYNRNTKKKKYEKNYFTCNNRSFCM